MKIRHLLLIGTIMTVLSVSAVTAEEAVTEVTQEQEESRGLLGSLFSEDGPLAGVLPEGTDVDTMVNVLSSQLGQADSEIGSVLGKVIGKAAGELGGFNTDSLTQYVGGLLGQFMGGGDDGLDDLGDFDFGTVFEIYDYLMKSEEEFILDKNEGTLDFGDAQIVENCSIYSDEFDGDTIDIRNFTTMVQNNYTMDEEGQLWILSSSEDVVFFRHQKDEDGGYPIVEATIAGESGDYTADLEAMCDEVGITLDECMHEIQYARDSIVFELKSYMEEHPEVTGIEFDGEIRTFEELEQMWNDCVDIYFAYLDEEDLTEDAGSGE